MLGVGAVFACGLDRGRRKEIIAMSTLQGGMRRGDETRLTRRGAGPAPWPCSVSSISSGSNVGWRGAAGAAGGGGGAPEPKMRSAARCCLESVYLSRSFQAPKEKETEDNPRKGEKKRETESKPNENAPAHPTQQRAARPPRRRRLRRSSGRAAGLMPAAAPR